MHLKSMPQMHQSQGAKVGQCVELSSEGCGSPLSCALLFFFSLIHTAVHTQSGHSRCWELWAFKVKAVIFQANYLSYCRRPHCHIKRQTLSLAKPVSKFGLNSPLPPCFNNIFKQEWAKKRSLACTLVASLITTEQAGGVTLMPRHRRTDRGSRFPWAVVKPPGQNTIDLELRGAGLIMHTL